MNLIKSTVIIFKRVTWYIEVAIEWDQILRYPKSLCFDGLVGK